MTIFNPKERTIYRMLFDHTDATEISGKITIRGSETLWCLTKFRVPLFRSNTYYYSGWLGGDYGKYIDGATVDEVMDKMEALWGIGQEAAQ